MKLITDYDYLRKKYNQDTRDHRAVLDINGKRILELTTFNNKIILCRYLTNGDLVNLNKEDDVFHITLTTIEDAKTFIKDNFSNDRNCFFTFSLLESIEESINKK